MYCRFNSKRSVRKEMGRNKWDKSQQAEYTVSIVMMVKCSAVVDISFYGLLKIMIPHV